MKKVRHLNFLLGDLGIILFAENYQTYMLLGSLVELQLALNSLCFLLKCFSFLQIFLL